jgi:sec-independent protein translocase protein TatB
MIEISFGKLLLLALVALVVLGPEKLPHAARTAGLLMRRMRNGWDNVRAEVEREIQAEEIKRTLRETAENARAAHDSVRDDLRAAGSDLRGAGDDLRNAGNDMRQSGDRLRDSFTETQAARAEGREPDPARDMLKLEEPHDRS